jgi:hypothetical protein
MFLQPGIAVPQLKQVVEGIRYGTVMDPHKNIDPKEQGRIKNRILELHGPGSAGFIPDSDLPWSQNERDNSFGGQEEMSTFGLPQKGSMIKGRHQAGSKYSPLYSGAVYSTLSKIKEWTSKGNSQKAATYDANTGQSTGGFNQKDHYGHKDPLGNLYHADMKSKTLTLDWTKFSEVKIKSPKMSWDVQDTNHDRNSGTQEDGSPTQIQGMGQKSQSSPGKQGDTVKGDVTWTIAGQKSHTVQGKVTDSFKDEHDHTVEKDHNINDNANHNLTVKNTFTRVVGASSSSGGTPTTRTSDGPAKTTIESSGSRTDKYSGKWSSQAQNMVWNWLTSRNTIGG